MTQILLRDSDGSLTPHSEVPNTPTKASKQPSKWVKALITSVVAATMLTLGMTPDAEARSKSAWDRSTTTNSESVRKNSDKNPDKKNAKKPKSKKVRPPIFKMELQGWATQQAQMSGYSKVNQLIAPFGSLVVKPANTPSVPNPPVAVTEQLSKPAISAKADTPAKARAPRVQVTMNPTTGSKNLGVKWALPRVLPKEASEGVVLSRHAESFAKLLPTAVLTDQQSDVLYDSVYVDRLHVIQDLLNRPRLTKMDGTFVVTNAGDLSVERAGALAVSDIDRALYIAGALNVLIQWKNQVDKAFLGQTSVLQAFQDSIKQAEPLEEEKRAQMRSTVELSLMILYTSGNSKNVAFAESARKSLVTEMTDDFLQNLADTMAENTDRPMATVNWVPGRLRVLTQFLRANRVQKN